MACTTSPTPRRPTRGGDRRPAIERAGRVDILVQAAGITGKTNVMTDAVEPENFDLVLRVNLRGIFLFCRAVLPTRVNVAKRLRTAPRRAYRALLLV